MAFEEDVAATIEDLLEAFCDFADVNAGFTRIGNKAITVTGSITDMYILERDGIYWYFYGIQKTYSTAFGAYGEIWMNMITVEPTDANHRDDDLTPYYLTKCSLFSRPNGPYVMHRFYSDGNHVNMVLEITPGGYTHMGIGNIDPFFAFGGGQYITGNHCYIPTYSATTGWPVFPNVNDHFCYGQSEHGTSSDEYNNEAQGYGSFYLPVGVPVGDGSDFAPSYGDLPTTSPNAKGRRAHHYGLCSNNTSNTPYGELHLVAFNENINQRNILIPCYCVGQDAREVGNTGDTFYYGHVNTCRSVNMTNLSAGQTIEIEWDVYPFTTIGGDRMAYPDSIQYGLAFKRIP